MPRDGSYTPDDPILDTLLAARAKFTGPESWFKLGHRPFHGREARANCIITAIVAEHLACTYLSKLITGKDCDVETAADNVVYWNNAPSRGFPDEHRTYEDVIELLDRAIAARRALTLELVA